MQSLIVNVKPAGG